MRLSPPAAVVLIVSMFVTAVAGAQAVPAIASHAADVAFMQGMIGHHAQAVEMVALIDARTPSPALRSLGERIGVSQRDEIGMMQRWLRTHGQPAPDPLSPDHAGMQMDHAMMPGMLTAAQMATLAGASGAAFDRLFLAGMIQHHQGAITMVKDLFATAGAGQSTDIFRFASDVDGDQRAEITRMRAMLDAVPR